MFTLCVGEGVVITNDAKNRQYRTKWYILNMILEDIILLYWNNNCEHVLLVVMLSAVWTHVFSSIHPSIQVRIPNSAHLKLGVESMSSVHESSL